MDRYTKEALNQRAQIWEQEVVRAKDALSVAEHMLEVSYLKASGQLQFDLGGQNDAYKTCPYLVNLEGE